MEIPAVTKYTGSVTPAPATIGLDIEQVATTTASLSLRILRHETAKILGRVGIERLGRFQHGEIVYELQITDKDQGIRFENVNYNEILSYVSLPELEHFENAQFERELVYEDPLPHYVKKRGRPPKAALQQVGLTSDEESDSSSIAFDGIAVSAPVSNPLKRPRNSSAVRGPGRPKKIRAEQLPSRLSRRDKFDFEHVALPQIKKRVKRASVGEGSLTNDFKNDDEALNPDLQVFNDEVPVDAGSSQLVMQSGQVDSDSYEAGFDNLPTGGSSHFKSSQLVEAAQPVEDEDLQELHPKLFTPKAARGRPKKHPRLGQSPENDKLAMLHAKFDARKPDKPKQSAQITSKVRLAESSSSEDEPGDLHQRFGATIRKQSSSLGNTPTSVRILNTPSKMTSKINKPSPRHRQGYRAPTLIRHPAHDIRNDASVSADSSTSPPAHPERLSIGVQSKTPPQDAIEISSDETNSPTPAPASRFMSASVSTLRPSIRPSETLMSQSRDIRNAAVLHGDVKSAEQASDEEIKTSSTESNEDDDDDEAAAIMNFEIPDIPSSQSFRASVSASSRSDSSGEQHIQAGEVRKTKRLAGNTTVPPRRQSVSMQNISRQVAAQSRAEFEARKQRDRDGNHAPQESAVSTGPGPQIARVASSKPYRFPGKSTVPPKSPKISMQNISQQVAAKSRAEVEARKREQAARAASAESTDSSTEHSDSYSMPPDSPPARKPVSSTLAARTQQREAPLGVTQQNTPKPYPLAFKQFAAAHQQQQQQSLTPTRKAIENTVRQSHESQARPQVKPQSHQTSSHDLPSSPILPVAHRESSISLGETPPRRPTISTARRPREASIDLEEPTPRPTTTKPAPRPTTTKPTPKAAPTNLVISSDQRSRPSNGHAKVEKTKNKGHRVSMTPLFPSAAGKGSPVKKGRVPFSTREFEGEV